MTAAPSPRVSVVIPTRNRARMVCEAVDGVLAQTFRDLEVIVVDDGSTDDTPRAIPARYGDRSRVRFLRQAHRGVSAARNRGIAESRSEFVALLDDDDCWRPEKLARQVATLEAEPAAALCFSDVRYRGGDKDGKTFFEVTAYDGDLSFPRLLLENFIVTPSTVLLRREKLGPAPHFREELREAEDWEFFLRLRLRHPFVCEPTALTLYRQHAENKYYRQPYPVRQRIEAEVMVPFRTHYLRTGGSRAVWNARLRPLHKRAARDLLRAGQARRARIHLLGWWRTRPWSLRPLWMWAGTFWKP